MKHIVILLLVTITIFSCTKESGTNETLLSKITVNGKVNERFVYNNSGQLIKDEFYSFCSTPTDEHFYSYRNSRVDSVNSVIRSIYSSTAAHCDPSAGLHQYAAFEYDNDGRISKVKRENSTTTYAYNAKGQIEQQVLNGGGSNYISTYKYDNSGNLVEVTDGQGNIMQYEFDNKLNPYFFMKRNPEIITAFYISPNNVVKVKSPGNPGVEIRYEYNLQRLPVKMFDSNGQTYEYVYQ